MIAAAPDVHGSGRLEKTLIRDHLSRAKAYATGTGLGSVLLRSVTGSGFVRGAAMLASFIVGVLLARALGTKGYGYYGMALAVISIAGVPGEMGIPRLVTREIAAALTRKDLAVVFGVLQWGKSIAWRISIVMAIAMVIAGLVLSRESRSPIGPALLFGAPMLPLLSLARIRGGALQGLHFIVRGQIPDIFVRPLVVALLVLALVVTRTALTPATAMALNSISAACVFLLADIWLRRRLPPRPPEIVHAGGRWFASSIPMGLTDGMRLLQSEMSVLLLGLIASPADVGLFRIASVTSVTAATPVAIINFVAFPVIARLYAEKDFDRLQQALTRLAQAQFAGVVALCLPLLLIPGLLLKLVFGADFEAAANVLRILAVAQIVTAAFGLNAALLNMTRHERRVTRAMVTALVVNLVALPIMAYFWGRIGAALAVAAALILWNVLTWADGRRLLGLETSVLPLASNARGVA
jgi:O-antigen/teichoic acid export membrane protein